MESIDIEGTHISFNRQIIRINSTEIVDVDNVDID